ncbi:Oxysterol-binding domain containing protein [Amanita muscaria]
MKNAILKSTNDRLRFEVHSVPTFRTNSFHATSPQTPTSYRTTAGDSPLQTSIPSPGNTKDTGGGGTQKWYMKANHPVEAARWTTAIERSIQYFKHAPKEREKAEKDRELKGIGAGLGFGLGSVSDMEMGIRKSGESDSSHHRSAHKSINSFGATQDPTYSGKSTNAPDTLGGSSSNHSQTLSSLPSFLRKAARSGGNMVREVRDKASLSKDMSKSWGTISGGHAAKNSAHSISMFAAEAVHSTTTPEPLVTSDGACVGGGEDEREDYLGEGVEEAEEDVSSLADSISRGGTKDSPPYENGFVLHANSVTAQLELTMQLAASLSTLPPPLPLSSFSPIQSSSTSSSSKSQLHQPSSSASSKSPLSSPPQPSIHLSASMQLHTALADSLSTLDELMRDYNKMVNERERWFKKKLGEEKGRQKVWEESLKVVVKEGEDLEKELKKRSRRRGSAFLGVGVRPAIGATVWSGGDQETTLGGFKAVPTTTTTPIVGAIKESPTEAGTRVASPSMTEQPEKEVTLMPAEKPPRPKIQTKPDSIVPGRPVSRGSMLSSPPATSLNTMSKIRRRSSLSIPVPAASPATYEDGGEAYTTDEEDEFFDAIESNTLPNLVVHASLAPTPSNLSRVSSISVLFDVACYSGYEKLRPRLKLSADNRPSTSLWSVLKGSIGKDLTKISFPVFFNEPTSMLQRMAEDMEFSECLDAAAKESDPLMRIAYVAAFAMSNYSSTIGRIAKPFNPMLSETFEYVRLDKQYRYMSEQVSHHPPISACWSESPLWCYYGEVDAQNKFMGKSFEIRPTGIAHVELLLPEFLGPGYPKASYKYGAGKVKEHYTWKKVTTNVSGFIFGSPTIDHYGDMVVTNHRTGDQCVLTFKPRGWRGKDAYEITGRVTDKDGNEVYDIAGRWNSQLVAKRCGHENDILDPDMKVNSPIHDGSNSPLAGSTEFILLWRNSEKPKDSPFNLTPFAITLNDCPRETLRPYLAPTDCRLRPDQRAFELGKYDLANTLKIMQEEKQRAVRKAREEGRVPPHRPRWFVAETDGDTGERVWSPVRIKDGGELEYWVQRERVHNEGGRTEKWTCVDDIFIEEPQEIKGL